MAAAITSLALSVAVDARASFPGANGRIFFIGRAPPSGSYDIWSVNEDGSGLVNLTDLPGGPGEGFDPSVTADGTRVAFTVGTQAASEVWIMNTDGSSPQQLTFSSGAPVQGLDQMPGIAPDGSRIAFMTTRDTPPMSMGLDYDIWVMNADGTNQQLLLNGSGEDYFPEFTPDGQRVVVASEVSGDLDIAHVPATGGPFTTATAVTGASNLIETTPSVRPDGTRVAFARYDPGVSPFQRDIQDAFFDGTDEFPIAADPMVSETTPSYSPDGTKIAYSSPAGLIIAAAGGADPAPVPLDANAVVDPTQPEWAPAPPDTAAPETEITKAPKDRSAKRKAKYRFESSEQGSTFECKLDKAGFKPCLSPRRYKRLKPKRHRFRVRATDAAGNTDPTPAKDRFRVLER